MEQYFSERNIAFLLYEVFDTESLTDHFLFSEYDKISFDLCIGISIKMASDLMNPCIKEMDRFPASFHEGNVIVSPHVVHYMSESGDGGWLEAFSGDDKTAASLPSSVTVMCNHVRSAANPALQIFSFLNSGLLYIIKKYSDNELASPYLQLIASGSAQGTVAFMESSCDNIFVAERTKAFPAPNGLYKITGQKHFVPAVYHTDNSSNIFLVSADVSENSQEQAFSLFLVPEKRYESGEWIYNDVAVTGLFESCGMKGLPYAAISMGDNASCYGIPVGEKGKASGYISELLTRIRINDSVNSAGICSRAFYESLEFYLEKYSKGSAAAGQIFQPVSIDDSEIQNLLLYQKSVSEGILCLAVQVTNSIDKHISSHSETDRERFLTTFLVPVLKFYTVQNAPLSVMKGVESLKTFGCFNDYSLEQCMRDITHSMMITETSEMVVNDFVSDNVIRDGCKAFDFLFDEIDSETAKRVHDELFQCRKRLMEMNKKLQKLVFEIRGTSKHNLYSNYNFRLFLELISLFVIGWQWYKQAVVASEVLKERPNGRYSDFYRGKIKTCIYFFNGEFTRTFLIAEYIKKDTFLRSLNSRELGL